MRTTISISDDLKARMKPFGDEVNWSGIAADAFRSEIERREWFENNKEKDKMEGLEKLNEAVKQVIEVANGINDEVNAEIWDKAPIIIHQLFCAKLVKVMKKKPKSVPKDVPEAMNVLNAIALLEDEYPKLKSK